MTITDILNNREIAVAIWILIFSVCILRIRSVRSSLLEVLKSIFDKKIITIILSMLLYVSATIYVFERTGFWDVSAIKDTVFWFVGTAFVMFVNINKVTSDENYFKNTISDQIKLILILEFVINLYTFSLALELIIIPIITIIAMTSSYAGIKPEHKQVKSFLDFILGVFGIVLIVFTIKEIASDFQGFLSLQNLRDFLLPIVFTIAFLPYIYLLALLSQYESIFVRIKIFNTDKRLAKYSILKIFLVFWLNLRKLNKFAKSVGVIKVNSKEDIEILLKKFKQ